MGPGALLVLGVGGERMGRGVRSRRLGADWGQGTSTWYVKGAGPLNRYGIRAAGSFGLVRWQLRFLGPFRVEVVE